MPFPSWLRSITSNRSAPYGDIETVCLRVFNAYGPGQHIPPVHTPVIPNFLRQAWENGTIVIHGDGNQTRDYVYVEDVVDAMVAASTAPEIDKLTINVGSGTETTIRELARLAVEVTGGHPEVVYNPRNEGGLSRLCADLTLAREKLGYAPQHSTAGWLENDPGTLYSSQHCNQWILILHILLTDADDARCQPGFLFPIFGLLSFTIRAHPF